jgi:ABC-type dipeptide/oligopeptide/nickel transport system permease component
VFTRRAYYALTASREIAESSELGVLRKHVLEVALRPISTMLATDMVQTINGQTFHDLPLIVAFVLVVLRLVVDLADGFVDPRIRPRGSSS